MEASRKTYQGLEDAVSKERFGTYLRWAGGDRDKAVELYTLNAILSESFVIPLHMLEVVLRNCIFQTLAERYGENWFGLPAFQLNAVQKDMIAKAQQQLNESGKPHSSGDMVASLTFGYWTSLLGKDYENLWQTTLNTIAKREDGKGLRRKDFSNPLNTIRILRNRLAHHETVLHWDLVKHHHNIIQLMTWLSPVAAEWCNANSRFKAIYPASGISIEIEK
jgi:hypothetical protein